MGKLIILLLDETEQNLYDQILKIVPKADISIDRKLVRINVTYKLEDD